MELTPDVAKRQFWQKKRASATLTLLTKVHWLIENGQQRGLHVEPGPQDADDLESQIAEAEREAARIVPRAMRRFRAKL